MIDQPAQGRWAILLSLLVALMLNIWPLPELAQLLRPDWVALVLIYWILAMPHRVNVGTAWLAGLVLDALTGSVLGQHALGLSVLALLVAGIHLRVRVFPLWQQAVTVMALLLIYEVILLMVDGATGQLHHLEWRWGPVLIGTLFWPWVLFLLRFLRRRFNVV